MVHPLLKIMLQVLPTTTLREELPPTLSALILAEASYVVSLGSFSLVKLLNYIFS